MKIVSIIKFMKTALRIIKLGVGCGRRVCSSSRGYRHGATSQGEGAAIGRCLILGAGLALALTVPLAAQTEYKGDGSPSPVEEEIRWLVNRARFSTAEENLARQTAYDGLPESSPPVAPNLALTTASRRHSEDMARLGLFQHETIPGSAFYDAVRQPEPWDRWRAEGYVYRRAGENIAAGASAPEETYLQWWTSTGHRNNFCNRGMREIGNGHFALAGSVYRNYYTQALAASGESHFFTGTIFRDANADGTYDINEGIAGVRIRLRIQGLIHAWFDVSGSAGNFAVPIESIPDRAVVEVLIGNPSDKLVLLSLPKDYARHDTVTLSPGQELVVGVFEQPAIEANVGWRNLSQPSPVVRAPELHLEQSAGGLELRWQSLSGLQYEPQESRDFISWTTFPGGPVPGTGAVMTINVGKASEGDPERFFRIVTRSR